MRPHPDVISQTTKQRLTAFLLPHADASAVLREASELSARLRPDGTWEDLAGQEPFAGKSAAPEHLARTLVLAQAGHGPDRSFDEAWRATFDFWLAHDFQAADWRQNQLAVPRLVGSIALLADERLSDGARGKVTEILARARWHHWVPADGWTDWTGIPLLRVAHNVLLRACVGGEVSVFEEAFARVFRAVRVASEDEEGIQPDMIYRGSRAEPSDARNGLIYAAECTRFVVLAHGTSWQAPAETIRLLTDFLLDGQQWLMRHGVIDAHFPAKTVHRDADTLEELAGAVQRLAQLGDAPRQAELASLGRRLAGHGESLAGHRHFWLSSFSVHQRPAFYASVCLPVMRPAEGTGMHPSASAEGMTCVMRSGGEYEGMSAENAADGLPGTTFLRAGVAPRDEPSPLSGGVSEGDYGLAAMRTARPELGATKAWFYFDHSFVCLGAGVSAGSNQPVFTSVNRCRLQGPVLAVADLAKGRVLTPGTEHTLPMVRRIVHDGITYHFTRPSRLVVQVGAAQGPGEEAVTPTAEQFALTLNHGLNPHDESYGYIVLPLGDDADAKSKVEEEVAQIEILANSTAVQAVRHRGLKLVSVAFWQAGMVALPGGGRVAANQPCVLICRDSPSSGKRLSIANLCGEATTVHIEYAGRCLCFELPGPDARMRAGA